MAYNTSDIIDALIECKGMIYLAAEKLGCNPATIYRRAESNKKVQETISNLRGRMIDKAEFALDNALNKEEPWAIQFALKNIGKGRGYTEKQEIEHSTDKDSPFQLVIVRANETEDNGNGK